MENVCELSRWRILITGAHGFAGRYTVEALRRICGENVDICATGKEKGSSATEANNQSEVLDVTDKAAVRFIVARYQPTHVIHLAGLSAIAAATTDPEAAWRVHVHGSLNVARAILSEAPDCWLIHIGSGLVYGATAKTGTPLDEDMLLAPNDEYSVTKAAADLAVGSLAHRGLKVLRMRPFNHTGPGQLEDFVVPSFAAQIGRIEVGLAPPVIRVGNLDAERDFLDVRDVATAYALALRTSHTLASNTILNIASGIPRRIGDILDWFLRRSNVKITINVDQSRTRPSDLPRIIGDAARARQALGWAPEHSFEDTLSDMLDYYRHDPQSRMDTAS
jgi:GDP-4-dehydro-6-deoxy-D-mannose reductase